MNNEPAFPHEDTCSAAFRPGMTIRDYFAAKAMQGWLASYPENMDAETAELGANATAKLAYRMADAMMKARGES